jgi:hypothetical protein
MCCEKYGVKFVENRQEMPRCMVDSHMAIKDLRGDAAKMTVLDIARHFHSPEKFSYDPRNRARRWQVDHDERAATSEEAFTAAFD